METTQDDDNDKKVSALEDGMIEMVKFKDEDSGTDPRTEPDTRLNPNASLSEKQQNLLTRILKYKSKYHLPDVSGATIQLKNLSFEVDATVDNSVETVKDTLNVFQRFKTFFARKGAPTTQSKVILGDISLTIRPQTSTLLLGPPGCGKSTLMKLIANQAVKGRVRGELLINGQKPDPRSHHHYIAYVTQEDNHIATFKVAQTAYFASLLQANKSDTTKEKLERADEVLKILGLDHRRETIIGNDYIRGLSGGEKKRMTIAVSVLKSNQCLLLDEPTTGLDATTSLDLFKSLNVLKTLVPIFACPLQPSSDIFFQFDNLVLMNKGKIIYQGPTKEALPFFARSGFHCPATKNPADFLLEVLEEMNETLSIDVPTSKPAKIGTPMSEPAKDSLYEFQAPEAEMKKRSRYNASFWVQLGLIIWRGFAILKNYPHPYIFRILKTLLVAIVYGSAYWQLDNYQVDLLSRSALGFAVVLYAGLSSTSNLGPYFEQRPVYYMQRRNYYYTAFSYFLGTLIVDSPMCMLESVVFGSIVYWMSGLKTVVGPFAFFLADIFILSYLILAMVRIISFTIPDLASATGLIPLVLILQLLYAGFVITYDDCWDGISWFFWVSPFYYGNQAITINELTGEKFKCKTKSLLPPASVPNFALPFEEGGYESTQICPYTTGEQFLDALNFKTNDPYKVYYFLVVVGFCAIFQILALVAMQFCYFPPPPPKGSEGEQKKEALDAEDKALENSDKSEAFLSWKNLNYSVFVRPKLFSLKKKELHLLKNVDGYVKPGMMLALMGPSGAGKSTLLDVLARRKTGGKITGEILLNGKKIEPNAFSHIMGYVEQQNLHIETVTVKEAIVFSAILRMSEKHSMQEKKAHAKWVLKVLELEKIEKAVLFQLSFEQMKRVTIGVELAADPAILFLDEPTSGLDARAAALVMKCVKNVALNSGKAVVCTIHQPAETVFRLFSHLLLLKRGGETVYFGELGEEYEKILGYFESNFGEKPEPMRNPADFVLDMCSIDKDIIKTYSDSKLHQDAVEEITSGLIPPNFQHPPKRNRYSAPFIVQYLSLTQRSLTNWWRQPRIVKSNAVIMCFLGIILGFMFFQLPLDQTGVKNRASLIYFGTLFAAIGMSAVIPLIVGERPTYTREQAASAYNPVFYVMGLVTAQLPIAMMSLTILTCSFYFIGGLRTDGPQYFFFFLLVALANVLVFLATNMICATWCPDVEVATGVSSTIVSLFGLFSGFMIRKESIPNYWIWFFYVSPQHYVLEALFANEFNGQTYHCPNNEGAAFIGDPKTGVGNFYCPITDARSYVAATFEFKMDRQWQDVGILFSMFIIMLVVVTIGIRYLQHIKR